MHRALVVAALASAVPASLAALQRWNAPREGTRITVQSAILGQERVLWVWTPPGYSSRRPGLPVLYLMDADVHYRHATALVQFLSYFLRAPDMIVVGLLHDNRDRDLLPPRDSGNAGVADRFLRFLTAEVRPRIERDYNTAPFTVLAGHSLGGLFATWAAALEPAAFNAYIAISPSLAWGDSLVLRRAREMLSSARRPRFFYLAMAANEPPAIATTTRSLRAALEAANQDSLHWGYAEVAGENHQTATYPALHGAWRWLFGEWQQPIDIARIAAEHTLAPFDAAFETLSRRYGYRVEPAELHFSIIGDRLYQRRAFAEAIELFARRVRLYPDSPEAHDELARGYAAAGRGPEALAAWDRAITLAETQNHPSLAAIRERRDSARGTSRQR